MREIGSTASFAAPPQAVWDVLFDFASYPEWNPFLVRMEAELAEDAPFKAMSRLPVGIKLGFVGHIRTVEPPTRVVWEGRPTLMPRAAMFVRHTFTLTPDGDGTRLDQVEEVTGFVVPVSGWILGQARKGQIEMSEAVAARLAGS